MYVLTIRDGLKTRHIGPYDSPQQAADHLDHWLGFCGEKAQWQIHQLLSPEAGSPLIGTEDPAADTAVAA
jgi:hypothetical protein